MKILMVEDSRILRDRLRRMLAEMPYVALVGETDNEADARLGLEKHRPDLVVLDLRLRSGSGLSVLEFIKARYPSMTVLILTNYGQAEYRSKCLNLGANEFFDKSCDIDSFAQCVRTLSQAQAEAAAPSAPRSATQTLHEGRHL